MSDDAAERLRRAAERVLKAAVAFQVADARLAKGEDADYLRFDKAQKAYALALGQCGPALADAVLACMDEANIDYGQPAMTQRLEAAADLLPYGDAGGL